MPDAVINSRNPYEIQEIEISNRTMSRIIIGVSVDQGGIDLFGQHVFIMYIDLKKPECYAGCVWTLWRRKIIRYS